MALITCYECKREISSSASSCPHCGAPAMALPADKPAVAADEPKKKYAAPLWLQVTAGLLGAYVVFSCTSGSTGSGSSAGGSAAVKAAGTLDFAEALTMCQMALKRAARDPDNANIPYVPDHGSGDEFYFAWGGSTKMVRMRNGLGLDVAASASCIVSKSQRRITSLTLNGQSLLSSAPTTGAAGVSGVQVGMTRGQVVMMLGEPSHTDYPGNGGEVMTWSGGAMVSMKDGRVVKAIR